MTGEEILSGTELTLSATVDQDILLIQSDKMSGSLIFHEGYAALLRQTEGRVVLHRVRIGDDPESIGHVEPGFPPAREQA